MIVQVGDLTFGWGSDVLKLRHDPGVYGPFVIDSAIAAALAEEITKQGHVPFTKSVLEEKQVFLVDKNNWRREVQIKGLGPQILQVRPGQPEVPVGAPPPPPAPPETPGVPDETPPTPDASVPDATGDDEGAEPPKEREGA